MPGAGGKAKRCKVPGVGTKPPGASSGYSRTSIAWPLIRAWRAEAGSGSPSAMRNCSSTRSRPVTLLGDRVLDLEPGVHLQEVKAPVTVQHELDGARSGVADRPAGRDGRGGQRVAKIVVDGRGRALLHDLLVAALDRALALEQVDHVAVGVTEDLDLDVPGVGDEPLQEHGAVAERGGRLAARAAHCIGQFRRVGDQPHTAAAAAKGRLDQQREANG